MPIHVSYAEMLRTAPEVLRMLGCSYGQAAEAVETLMLSHAALRKGYALVRLSDTGGKWKAPVMDESQPGIMRVDLDGAPLLLFAGLLADALAARARQAATELAVATTAGGWTLPYICHRLSRHGLYTVGSWQAPAGAGPDEAPAYTASSGPSQGGAPIAVSLGQGVIRGPVGLSIRASMEAIDITAHPAGETIVFDERLKAFMADGFEVDATEHRDCFTGVAARIRIAYSERSRSQAG